MSILRKIYEPAYKAVVIPGTPSIPGHPAYCHDEVIHHDMGYKVIITADPGDPATGRPPGYLISTVSTGPYDEVVHTCYPATEGVPGGPPTIIPAVEAKYYAGWNAAADSIPSLSGDGIYQVTADASAVGIVTGITPVPIGVTYTNITHGIYFASGQYQYIENGTPVSPKGGFSSADVFTIVRIGTQVSFYKGNALDYTSSTPSTGTVWADASLYFGGDAILNALFDTTVPAGKSGVGEQGALDGPLPPGNYPPPTPPGGVPRYTSVNGILQGVHSGVFGANQINLNPGPNPGDPGMPPTVDGNGDWQGRTGGTLRELTGTFIGNSGTGYNYGSLAGTLTPVKGVAFSGGGASTYSILNGTLTSVFGNTGGGGDLLTPQYVVMNSYLGGIGGFSYGLYGPTNSLTGKMLGLRGLATNLAGGSIGTGGSMLPGSGNPIDPTTGDWDGRSGGYLRNIIGLSYSADAIRPADGIFIGELSSYLLQASGHSIFGVFIGLDAALSGYSFRGYGGGSAVGKLPLPTFIGSGTVTTLGRADLALSGYALLASGTTHILGQVYATYQGSYALTGYGGGQLNGVHGGHYLLSGHGIGGAVGRAVGELPSPFLVASGTVHNFGGVIGILPPLTVGISGLAAVTLSHYIFVGTGYEGFATATVYEGYSVTLIPAAGGGGETTATTHYPIYPFDRILRFGDDYYGVAADGLYRLDGNTFDGVEIISVVETAQTDFKERSAKRPVSLFLAGRMDTKLKVSVTAAEDEKNTYTYTGTWEGVGNQRVRFGRGIKARYLAYGFTNHTGEDFDVDELAPEIEVLRRNQ